MDTPVTGTPRVLLRVEGLALLIAIVVAFRILGGSWVMFAVLLLVPDASMLGYLAGPRVGAVAYNALHTYIGPVILAALSYAGVLSSVWPICLIWVAHIAMDRALGFGLKFSTAFNSTHLGSIGRVAPAVGAPGIGISRP